MQTASVVFGASLLWLLSVLAAPGSEASVAQLGEVQRSSPVALGQSVLAEDRTDIDALAEDAVADLYRVAWTTPRRLRLSGLSHQWDIPRKQLIALNPKLERRAPIAVGTLVWVYSADSSGVDQSIGFPNKGRVVAAVPMPEGDFWRMRRGNERAYGTRETIESLVSVLTAYGEAFPDAPIVQVGDISVRKGGTMEPHRSHQTGRDVDLRLVRRTKLTASGRERRVIDLQKNWFILKRIVATGKVQSIYLNAGVQKRLWPVAEADVGVEAADRVFEMLQHEHGHRGHMHVRFRCPAEHRRCIADSRRAPSG